jgi:hypothetical protein
LAPAVPLVCSGAIPSPLAKRGRVDLCDTIVEFGRPTRGEGSTSPPKKKSGEVSLPLNRSLSRLSVTLQLSTFDNCESLSHSRSPARRRALIRFRPERTLPVGLSSNASDRPTGDARVNRNATRLDRMRCNMAGRPGAAWLAPTPAPRQGHRHPTPGAYPYPSASA